MISRFGISVGRLSCSFSRAFSASASSPVSTRVTKEDIEKGINLDEFEIDKSIVSPVMAFKDGPERDLVNFPRPVRREKAKVRIGLFPEEWFHAMYEKTGVCGPYIFGVGGFAVLMSKEWIVLDHELMGFFMAIPPVLIAIQKLGPMVTTYLEGEAKKQSDMLKNYRETTVKEIYDTIENENAKQKCVQSFGAIFDAKKENIHLQLEAEYRQRQMTVYSRVKRHLEYQLQSQQIVTNFRQRNQVDWVVQQVNKSITPQQEQETLKSCLSELKLMAKPL